jgi:Tfp pilus assembly protein PilF
MEVGYAAFEQGDYQTALINFRRALQARPGDRYATDAIANTEAIINRN